MKNRNLIFTIVLLALGFSALCPIAQAVVPAPDGGYPGGNTAEGQNTLLSLTSGIYNTAVGIYSLLSLTDGKFNTAIGAGTLLANTAEGNTATGAGALLSNSTGGLNTANGEFALFSNTTGGSNTAIGEAALFVNTTGGFNTATGANALQNTVGDSNTADGSAALFSDTTGQQNTAVGDAALTDNTTGSNNTAIGESAGSNQTTGSGNVYIGFGMSGVAGENGHTYIANINTSSVSGGNADFVTVDLTTGLLGHLSSSRRYKEDIKPMDNTSEALYRLKPVTYRYKKEIDTTQSPAFGLIAEEVAEVNPDLVVRNAKGQPETVHYDAVNAMLLNEFLKEHKKVEEQQSTITQLKKDFQVAGAEQQKEIRLLTAQLKEQAAQIQKVSAQVEVSGPASQVVTNKP